MGPEQKDKDNHVAAYSNAVTRAYKLGFFKKLLRRRPSPSVAAASLALVVSSIVLTLVDIAADAMPKQVIDLTSAFYPLIGLSVLSLLCGVFLFWFGTSWKRAMFELMNWEQRMLEGSAPFENAARAETRRPQ